ncbi:BZ3500_MvSof-1268-A1-R1_Chr3-1g06153 [Microbotryum saponariae]|uniref:BZ3500_MvSof-1268-A1-R1_Chr3-1g06153 protein n=1 Tax=Microbotryum saponariae TaxID=289078 RepID=A0A2X0NF31_9BASI|nr:BZ3500_MvSof-1268-A1-R1_Chr3-1g06153 [Microbotryum saponariae]SDA04016.1 BZ3501_MvSof-1269-A2-R1_Chr3-2g05838 [Microbotryum saponariae]
MPTKRTLKPAIAIHTTTVPSSAGGSGSASLSVVGSGAGAGGGGGAASIGHARATSTSRSRTPSASISATLHPNRAKSNPLANSRDITPEFAYDHSSRNDSHDQLDSDDDTGRHSPVFNQYGSAGASSSSSSLLINGGSTAGLNPQQLRSLARKERNRVAAQKSRDRKKDEFEGLSAENEGLREEIRALKDQVRKLDDELSMYRGVGGSKASISKMRGLTSGQGSAKKRRVKGASTTSNESAERGPASPAPAASVPMIKLDSRRSMASTSTGFTSLDELASRRDEEDMDDDEEEEEEEYEYDDGNDTETERDEVREGGLMLDEALLRIISEQDILKDEDEEDEEEDEEIMNIARVMGTMREAAAQSVRPGMFRRKSSNRTSTVATPNAASAADSGSNSAESSLPLSPKRKRKGSAASIQGNSRTLFPAIASVLRGTLDKEP